MDLYDWNRVREDILLEVLPKPDPEEILAAAGLLFDFRLILTSKVRELTEAVEGFPVASVAPLTLNEAASVVARLYALDPRDVERNLRAEWRRLKTSDVFQRVRKAVEGHRFVDHLEPFESA